MGLPLLYVTLLSLVEDSATVEGDGLPKAVVLNEEKLQGYFSSLQNLNSLHMFHLF